MPLPSDIVVHRHIYTLERAGIEVELTPMQFRLFMLVAEAHAGLRPSAAYMAMYSGAREPETGVRTIHQFRVQLNVRLRQIRLKVTTNNQGGGGSIYRLEAA